MNNGLKLILDAYPTNLEVFKFDTDGFEIFEGGDAINMNFCGLKKLQEIDLSMPTIVEYYTMNQANKQGQRWKTFEKTFDLEPSSDKCHTKFIMERRSICKITLALVLL